MHSGAGIPRASEITSTVRVYGSAWPERVHRPAGVRAEDGSADGDHRRDSAAGSPVAPEDGAVGGRQRLEPAGRAARGEHDVADDQRCRLGAVADDVRPRLLEGAAALHVEGADAVAEAAACAEED